MKKQPASNDQPRIFSRRKARELDVHELAKVSGGMPVESHCFCPGGGMDDCDVY